MDYSEGRQGDLEEPGVSQLRPHGTEWLVETEGIQIDYYDGAKRNLDFIWTFDNPVKQRSPLEYFCAMFPMVEAAFWIEKTNACLAEMKQKPLSKCEYFRFWELILAISIGSEKNRRNYWMEELDGESGRIFQPPAFDTRFEMGIVTQKLIRVKIDPAGSILVAIIDPAGSLLAAKSDPPLQKVIRVQILVDSSLF